MKICAAHWDELKAAIKARGLWDLVATSGEEAFGQAMDELKGKEKTLETFDPLMAANWALMSNAIQGGGLYLMYQKPDGTQYCPVCEAASHGHTGWIELAANGAAEQAVEYRCKRAESAIEADWHGSDQSPATPEAAP